MNWNPGLFSFISCSVTKKLTKLLNINRLFFDSREGILEMSTG